MNADLASIFLCLHCVLAAVTLLGGSLVLQLTFFVLSLWMGCIWVTWGKGASVQV